ncbi:glycoside hydrolase family 3 protein [bacterium]|nr:glycoside hydrolase family 3 protein [bacterium]
MEEIIFQKFILGTGEYLDDALNKGLGGVIFFTRDIQSEHQFKELIENINNRSKIKPFLSIDQEGGRVERTENISKRRLSPKFAYTKGIDFLRNQSEEIAKQLSELGINLNFSPCADVNTNSNNPIIGERSFADNPDDVIKGIQVVSEAYRKYGIIPCVKHFPGHGDADKDSHLTLPVIDLPIEKMESIHIRPFKYAVEHGIEMIMAAHLHCTCFDKNTIPSSLSKNAIGYLRNNLNYNGVIISDDMVMKGVQDYGALEACIMAINAGVDMFIFRDADESTYNLILELAKAAENNNELKSKIIKSNKRIQRLKTKI